MLAMMLGGKCKKIVLKLNTIEESNWFFHYIFCNLTLDASMFPCYDGYEISINLVNSFDRVLNELIEITEIGNFLSKEPKIVFSLNNNFKVKLANFEDKITGNDYQMLHFKRIDNDYQLSEQDFEKLIKYISKQSKKSP
jgi:hypothetical protein